MVQDEISRQEFAERLRDAMRWAGWPERGSQARLASLTKATAKAASKWVNGESMPRRGKLKLIAAELKVNPIWLEYGEGSMAESLMEQAEREYREKDTVAALNNLKDIATPRSRQVLDRIAMAVKDGRLSEADLVLLEGIAARFEKRKPE
ncbi:MAG: hypothetical protein Q7Q73_09280 [Verrucomicrobiota bacterium JB024]|nr:hypothetical protein [Verrucomicrobiota bacterium JB024]